jgi:hypothetical protein
MKLARICIAVFAGLVFAPLCAAQCGPQPAAKSMGATESMIIANEKQIADAVNNNKPDDFKKLVSMDGWVISPMGTAKVADIINYIFNPDVKTTSYAMEDSKVMMIDANTALLTYKSIWAGTDKGKAMSENSYDSTLWVKRDGKWWAVFHQTTKVEMPPAKPAETK